MEFSDISEESGCEPDQPTLAALRKDMNFGHVPSKTLPQVPPGEVEEFIDPTPIPELYNPNTEMKKRLNPSPIEAENY